MKITFIFLDETHCGWSVAPIYPYLLLNNRRMSFQKLIMGASGIYIAYLSSSILAEKLYSTPYKSIKDQTITEKFHFPSLIVWFSSLLCALFGFVRGNLSNEPANPISKKQQIKLGVLYTVNILSANYALLYISYLTQVIGRNCRYLLVVIVGAFFSRVKKGSNLKLNPKKVIVAAVITAGVLLFTIMKTNTKSESHLDSSKSWIGYLLLILSVTSDALFSDNQAYSKVNFHPTANHLFTSANFLTFVFVFIFSFLEGNGIEQFSFCLNHPAVILDIFLQSCLQVVGQVAIYFVIANFKQHIFPLISTTRKVFTVLLSILIYNHSVNWMQWMSIVLVFGGLAYELKEEIEAKKAKGEKESGKEKEEQKEEEKKKKKSS